VSEEIEEVPEENEELLEEQPEQELDAEQDAEGIFSVDGLREELNRVKAQAEEYLDGWQRARAEFSNYKKRVTREREETHLRMKSQAMAMPPPGQKGLS
jgi:molecular chaperone GrpE